MSAALVDGTAQAIAAAVRTGAVSAREIAQETLDRIEARNGALGAFTEVTAKRALAKADAIDAARVRGENLGPLAGAPFAVKNLFDVEGLTTRAGSKINRDHPPAKADATMITRLEAAGGVLVGALNMGEYAYDFTGRNVHDGPSRNPHDLEHMTGGSSGGSAAAVAGGLVPIALGSDTNGSIRVPSSFCGLFGLKPTYGRLSCVGTFPFVASLDHVGPLARSAGDLALSYDSMLGREGGDSAQADKPAPAASPMLNDGVAGLRIARLGGYFARSAEPSAISAVDTIARALKADRVVERGRTRALCGLSHHHGRGGRASSCSVARTRSKL
jgi:AtzE family amidohydrolase